VIDCSADGRASAFHDQPAIAATTPAPVWLERDSFARFYADAGSR